MFSRALVGALLTASLASAQSLTALIGKTSDLSSLGAILKAYPSIASSLADLKNVTIFAPNNAAIKALQATGALSNATEAQIAAVLNYHVVPGVIPSKDITSTPVFAPTLLTEAAYTTVTGGQVVEVALVDGDVIVTSGLKAESTVTSADNKFNGGIVHIVDTVLTIPPSVAATALAANLTALVGAATAAGVTDTLATAKDITIFAPDNAAFAAIGSGLGNLTAMQIAGILEYHVISGTVAYSSDIKPGKVKTLEGADVTIAVEGGAVFVNAARVINADVLISGGVLHVIDSVLNPMDPGAKPKPGSDKAVPQYTGVSSAPLAALTSALPAASTTVSALVATTEKVAAAATGGSGGNGGGSGGNSGGNSDNAGALPTAAIGAAALFGGAALVMNW